MNGNTTVETKKITLKPITTNFRFWFIDQSLILYRNQFHEIESTSFVNIEFLIIFILFESVEMLYALISSETKKHFNLLIDGNRRCNKLLELLYFLSICFSCVEKKMFLFCIFIWFISSKSSTFVWRST